MSGAILSPRRTLVFAGDSVTDCGRRDDPERLGDGYVRHRYDEDDPTSTESFEASYRALLEPLRTKVVLVEPFLLAVKEEQHAWREDLDPKIEVVRRLAAEYGAILVPADVEFNRRAEVVGTITLADDGVHPTDHGHWFLAELWHRALAG